MKLLPIDLPTPEAPRLDWERLDAAFPWLRALAGCPQDPVHHAEGDVAVHTRMVCEEMAALPAWRALPVDERAQVLAAALFHDIAKPATTRCDADGRVTAPGHSRRGELMARAELYRMGVAPALREAVAGLVRHHQVPFFLVDQPDALRRAIGVAERARGDHLALLAEADMRGRVCEDPARALDNVALYRVLCEESELLRAPWAFANGTSRYEFFTREGRDPHYAAHEGEGFEVVLMCGLPGSGKDTWVAENRPGDPVVSLDDLRDALDVDPADDQGAVVSAAKEKARALLRARTPFVWNATNLTRQRRAELVSLFADYGARVRLVYVEVPYDTLRRQNRERERERRVPERVLSGMIDRWEAPVASEAHAFEAHVRAE
ncbi:MAG: AAA family ATPase [Polyangiales bacterium]